MSESKEIAVAEQPQQLITIEPAKYVALVFESFRKKFDAYKAEADEVKLDVTTTAGMKTAVEWRAKFRDEIRIASENARKERKVPILEIGRLLDGAAKEIAEEVAPYESRFDSAIKAEEKRKDDEKIAKAVAESARITVIRKRIAETQAIPAMLVGKSSETIAAAIESLEAVEITLETHAEFAGEGEMAKIAAIDRMKEMHVAQLASEQAAIEAARQAEADRIERERVAEANRIEAKRLADLAAELERQAQVARDKQAEADRQAAAARAEQEAKDRAERERIAEEQRVIQVRAATLLREQQEAHEARMAAERAELARQQAELAADRAEQERITREAWEAAEAAAKLEADHAEALIENARIDADRAAAAESARIVAQRQSAEAERLRRERVNFLENGPSREEILAALSERFEVYESTAEGWLSRHKWVAMEQEKAA